MNRKLHNIKNNMKNSIDNFNIEISSNQLRTLVTIVIILVIILLFRKNFHKTIEKAIVFTILFLLFLVISKNIIVTFIATCIVFLLVNLIINYRNTIEKFEDINKSEPTFDTNIFNTDDFKKSANGIQDLLKKVNGGIALKDDDLKETGTIGIDTKKYSDDEKPNPLKKAQKEAYELIDTVNALKDTVNTLAPVLLEGKKLMGIFQSLQI